METLKCDVAVIGAGTAGLAAERAARRAGASTLLIDDRFAGTTCASVGCMPSKLLIAAAEAVEAVRRANVFGVQTQTPVVDGPAVMKRLRELRDGFVKSVEEDLAKLAAGIKLQGRAKFLDCTTVEVEAKRVQAKAVVIATGAKPSIPKAFADVESRILTNETIFELPSLPRSIGVVGAGPLGLELAQALARLDVEVMLFDQGGALAAVVDAEIQSALHRILRKAFAIQLGVKLSAALEGEGVLVEWSGDQAGRHHFDYLLVAAGRPPQLDDLDLPKTGIALDKHGVPVFDPQTMQCDGSAIFIAGDADHDRPVLHEASDEGAIAGHNAAVYPNVAPGRRNISFSVMFTDPPLAVIGKTPKAADEAVVAGGASYEDQGRAKIMARNQGLVRLYADAADGKLRGATLFAPGAEHAGHLIAWSIQQGLTARQVLDLPFYHPTFEEGLRPALTEICEAVDSATPDDRDNGVAPGA